MKNLTVYGVWSRWKSGSPSEKLCKAPCKTSLFNLATKSGGWRRPIQVKGALVFPNLKEGGKRSDPASWRPISHTSQLSLVFERFLKDIIVTHLETIR